MKLSRFLAATALAGFGAVTPSIGLAQTTVSSPTVGNAASTADEAQPGDAIVVTGSRIRRPNDSSTVPITSVTNAEIFQSGRISIGDALNELPQLRSTVSSQNSTSGLGVRGLNLLDLRGLGTARTLVLINGRRHVSSEIINNGSSPDINTFPTDLIDRIDIVTGGASSIYGSDAIAGVVNFILKDHYDGVQVHGQTGVSTYKDAGNQYISLLAGKNFFDGRGNVAVNVEYSHQSQYFASDRPALAQVDGFLVVETDPAGSPNGAAGGPDRLFFRDIRSTTISTGGQVGLRQGAATAPCGADRYGAAFTCASLFQADGSLVPQTGLRVGLGPNGAYIGGNGYIGREGKLVTLTPELSRINVNAIGHLEISPAFVPFFEAKYVHATAFGSQSGPFFSQGQTLGDTVAVAGFNDRSYNTGNVNREGIRLDNPFLSAGARATLTQQIRSAITAGINPNTGGALTAATQALSLAQVTNGTYRFSVRRNYVDLGIRDERITRNTYRGVIGAKGDFADDFHYEVSATYGEHHETNVIQGNINRQRFLLANDSARNAAGQIVCRSQIDPAYAGADRGGNPAQLATDIAACVPLNPFGDGSVTDAARGYLTASTVATGKATQLVVSGFVNGTSHKLFDLPGGPIGFALGGEYRRETLNYNLDPLTQAGYNFYNAIPTFNPPAFSVVEGFGELSVPLLKDVPFFQELTVTGSGRVAKYKGISKAVYAYSGGVEWKPIDDIRLRGSYSRAVRAPYLGEVYSPNSQNFAPGFTDPCSARNLGQGSPTRAANCTAAGLPAGYDYVYSSSLEIVSGGNPGLQPETSRSITAGFVLTPRVVPGLSLSADYYNITVNQVIASVSAQNIANLCYDSPSLTNPFCGLFTRAGAGGGPRGEVPGQILQGSLLQSSANFAKRKARGVDVNAAYTRRFEWGQLSAKGVYTHVYQRSSYNDPTRPNFEDVLVNELNYPSDRFNINVDVKLGKLTFGYGLRWIGGMYLNTFEDYNSVNGNPPENADYAEFVKYPIVTYSDIRAGYDVNERFNLYGGVNNVGNRLPPFGLTGVGAGSAVYDNRGRFFYVGATAKF